MFDLNRPGGLFTVGLYGMDDLTDEDRILLDRIRPSGVILFQRNIRSGEQVDRFIRRITDFLGYKPLVAIDQEGGVVTRLTEGFTVAPGAMALAATGESRHAYEAGRILGREMKAIGVDWDLAPVVDINNNRDNPGIGVRSFGETREIVTEYAGRFVEGLAEEGILSCLKHFPGKGRVAEDAHYDMPELKAGEEVLFADELYPYMNIDAPSWMPSHVYYPALQTVREPASVSREILTTLARERLGFTGVLISDDMTMGGITRHYDVSRGVVKSFYAGMDNLLVCHDFPKQMESYEALAREVERNEEARQRMTVSLERMGRLYSSVTLERPSLDCLASEDHVRRMGVIDRRSVGILKDEENLFPLGKTDLILAPRMKRLVQVEDVKVPLLPVVSRLSEKTGAPVRLLEESDWDDPAGAVSDSEGKRVVLFTENAHLDKRKSTLTTLISGAAESIAVCALRNPYDRDIEGVKNIVCSYGYSRGQQERLLEILLGNVEGRGK